MPRKVKRTKLKGKPSTVTQKVIVNVSKRGGTKRTGPPQPSQAQQLLQTLAPLLAQRQPLIQSSQPLLPSAQQLESLFAKLAREGPPGPPGPQGPQGFYGPQGPRGFPGRDGFLQEVQEQARERAVSQYGSPRMSESSGASLPSFAFNFDQSLGTPAMSESSGASLPSFAFMGPLVAEQPAPPLVQPAQPAVSVAPMPLEGPEEKQERRPRQDAANLPYEDIAFLILDEDGKPSEAMMRENLVVKRKGKENKITYADITNSLGIVIPRGKTKRDDYIEAIINYYKKR